MNALRLFFISIRWRNLLMAGLSLVINYFFLLLPILNNSDSSLRLVGLPFFLLTMSVLFIMAGGYVINDILDVETDEINQKQNNFVFQFDIKTAYWTYGILTLLGLIFGLCASWMVGNPKLSNVHLISVALLWAYSYLLKMYPIVGNIIISMICALVPLLPVFFNNGTFHFIWPEEYYLFYFLALLALVLTMGREIVKDAEDVEGDQRINHLTLAVLFGRETSKFISIIFSVFGLFLSCLMTYSYWYRDLISALYTALFLALPLLVLIYKTMLAEHKGDYYLISQWYKWVLFFGILYPIVYYFQMF